MKKFLIIFYLLISAFLLHANTVDTTKIYITKCWKPNFQLNGQTLPIPDLRGQERSTLFILEQRDTMLCRITQTYLTINYPTYAVVDTTICDNHPYVLKGKEYNTSGTYIDTITNSLGCDSIVTLNLTVKPVSYTYLDTLVCDSIRWNGKRYVHTGIYTYTTTAANGCDSIVTLDLTVNKTQYTRELVTACDSYTWNGETYTRTGVYTFNGDAANGCDSVAGLILTILNSSRTDIHHTACDSYTWKGKTYTESGIYCDTATAANGCDSIISLHLTINKSIATEESITACDSYTWNGETYTQSGDFIYTTTAANGCDSVITLHLIINQTRYTELDTIVCDSLLWNGTIYRQTGNYTYTTIAANGCDSIVTLDLIVNKTQYTHDTITACDFYTWNGETYTESGDFYYHSTSQYDCDSIAILHLTVNHRDTAFFSEVVCDSIVWIDSMTYNQTGTYYRHLKTIKGCDSIQVLDLTVWYSDTTQLCDTMRGFQPYEWHGVTLTQGGKYINTISTHHGCDSVLILTLIDNPIALTNEYDTLLCANEPIQFNLQSQGFTDQWNIYFSENAYAEGARDSILYGPQSSSFVLPYFLRAGRYELNIDGIFHDSVIISRNYPFTILYPSSIFEQRSNSLLAILNANYNGGYDLTHFQWYVDGNLLIDETKSYLNRPLSFESEYTVLLSDSRGVQLMSCSFVPVPMSSLSIYPTLLQCGAEMQCYSMENATLELYTATGCKVSTHDLLPGKTLIKMPMNAGIYLVQIITENNKQLQQKVLVR